jgi:hypothetical protein
MQRAVKQTIWRHLCRLMGPAALVALLLTFGAVGPALARVSAIVGCSGGHGFATETNYPTGPFAQWIALGDFNGDARVDLAVANYDAWNTGPVKLSLLLGNGNGTFQPAVNHAAGRGTAAVATADFDGDGKLDAATANYESKDVSVLLGNGDGTLRAPVAYTVGANPRSIVAADFDGDGRADLATANYGSDSASVLRGNGDGTFQTQVSFAAGPRPRSVAVGDFNSDGKADLALPNAVHVLHGPTTVSILRGNGDATFQPPVTHGVGSIPSWVAVADFDADGSADLAVVNHDSSDVSVLRGNGNGTFQSAVQYPVGAGPYAVATADFDGDGTIDLATASVYAGGVTLRYGNGDGTFQAPTQHSPGGSPVALAAGDLNADGRPDLAVAKMTSGAVSVLLSTCAVDSAPPAIGYAFTPTGSNGWFRTAPAVGTLTLADAMSGIDPGTLVCTDTLSGLAVTGGGNSRTLTITGQGEHVLSCSVKDLAGNSATATTTVKIDTVLPVVTHNAASDYCTVPGSNGWCRGAWIVHFTAADGAGGAGLLVASQAAFEATTAPSNGPAIAVSSGQVCDAAGNCATALSIGPFKVDAAPPTCELGLPTVAPRPPGTLGGPFAAVHVAVNTADAGGSGLAGPATIVAVTNNGPGANSTQWGNGPNDVDGNVKAVSGTSYDFDYLVQDVAGNATPCSGTVTID